MAQATIVWSVHIPHVCLGFLPGLWFPPATWRCAQQGNGCVHTVLACECGCECALSDGMEGRPVQGGSNLVP